MKIGMKYCGGCNPRYDRVAAAERIRARLVGSAEFVRFEDPAADLILVFMGCQAACADMTGFDMSIVRLIGSDDDAESFNPDGIT